MGYTTTFNGEFEPTQPLTPEQKAYLLKFAETRRMKRDSAVVEQLPDPLRKAVGLPIGQEGEYYVGGSGFFDYAKTFLDKSNDQGILDHNSPPASQPGLWCQWIPTEDGQGIKWDEGEKFYYYVEWIKYLIKHFLEPWGNHVNGEVHWQGEGPLDEGIIEIKDNVVRVGRYQKKLVYDE